MQICHRPDEADALFPAWDLIVGGRTVRSEFRLWNQTAIKRFDWSFRLKDRHEIMFIENVTRAHWHHLDEAQDQIARPGEFYQRDELVLIATPHQHSV